MLKILFIHHIYINKTNLNQKNLVELVIGSNNLMYLKTMTILKYKSFLPIVQNNSSSKLFCLLGLSALIKPYESATIMRIKEVNYG